jgi:hypothetical protein
MEREIAALPKVGSTGDPRESDRVTAVSVDSAWLKHYAPPMYYGRQVISSLAEQR